MHSYYYFLDIIYNLCKPVQRVSIPSWDHHHGHLCLSKTCLPIALPPMFHPCMYVCVYVCMYVLVSTRRLVSSPASALISKSRTVRKLCYSLSQYLNNFQTYRLTNFIALYTISKHVKPNKRSISNPCAFLHCKFYELRKTRIRDIKR